MGTLAPGQPIPERVVAGPALGLVGATLDGLVEDDGPR